jgi:hypothetical protein
MLCENGFCRGMTAISNVLVAVALPASENLAQYSNTSFVLPLQIPSSGQADITLPALESITIDTNLEQLAAQNPACDYARDGSYPIEVQISHRWPVEGLETGLNLHADDMPAPFSALPVDADYEVHLTPSEAFQAKLGAQGASCALPPVLFRNVAVGVAARVTLNWPAPRSVGIDVRVPAAAGAAANDLTGWQLDVVDPIGERELATPVTLGPAQADASDPKISHYRATIAYNPIASAGSSPPGGTEQLRLRPNADRVAPTYYATLSSLSLFGSTGESVLELNGMPEQVVLSGRVESADDLRPIANATVTLTSTNFGSEGLNAKFRGATTTDSGGLFQITLPSGQYQVSAEPPNSDEVDASVEASWSIQATPAVQAGRLLSLPPLVRVAGSVNGSVHWGSAASASFRVTPSSKILYDAVSNTATMRQVSPGARTMQALFQPAQESSFQLLADSGTFDVSLRPPEGLPWIVTPGVQIGSDEVIMSPWSMPLPAYWIGHVRVPLADGDDSSILGDVPRAFIRVFVLVNGTRQVVSATAEAATIVQIAETRAGADGSFNLVLPNELQWQ